MIWVSIVLGILQALPTLLPIIRQIIEAIRGKPGLHGAFQSLLLANADLTDPAKAEAEIRAFHAQHVLGQPAA